MKLYHVLHHTPRAARGGNAALPETREKSCCDVNGKSGKFVNKVDNDESVCSLAIAAWRIICTLIE